MPQCASCYLGVYIVAAILKKVKISSLFFSVLRLMQTADVLASFKVSVQGNTVFYELMVQVQLPWWRLDE